MMIRGILVGPGFRLGNSASRRLRGSPRPPRPPSHDAPGPGACARPPARRAARPRSARCGAGRCARTPRPPVCLGASSPGPDQRAPDLLAPPGLRAASSCAGRRTCRTPRVSSCLVWRITSGTRVRAMGRLPGARRTGQPVCCRTGQTVCSRQSPPWASTRRRNRVPCAPVRDASTCGPLRSPVRAPRTPARNGACPREVIPERKLPWPDRLDSLRNPRHRGAGTGSREVRALAHRCVRSGHREGRAVFERRRHAPAGAPDTGGLP